jgi:hypothetical protein
MKKEVAKEFRSNLANITRQSATVDPFFNSFVSALEGYYNETEGRVVIVLDLKKAREVTSAHVVEEAIRIKIGDTIKSRPKDKKRVDVVYDGKEIECKHSLVKHKSAPIDYVGIKKTQDKWYLLTEGPMTGDTTTLSCFLYRSDFYYEMIKAKAAGEGKESIDIETANDADAILAIESEIDLIKNNLAKAILHKAKGNQGLSGERMSLHRKIGLNKIRFILAFESVVKDYMKLLS